MSDDIGSTVADTLIQLSCDTRAFTVALTDATRAIEGFSRELRWVLYVRATGRSALSEAIKPW